jgi:hypothetical protein
MTPEVRCDLSADRDKANAVRKGHPGQHLAGLHVSVLANESR